MSWIVPNGTRYNYRVDVDHGRIWLEDDGTKRQWQWRSDEPLKTREVLDGKQIPERTFLTAVKHLFAGHSTTSGRVQLEQGADGSLQLNVEVALAMSNWCAKEALVLKPLSLQPIDFVHARLDDVLQKIAKVTDLVETRAQREQANVSLTAIRQQLMSMEHQLTALQKTSEMRASDGAMERAANTLLYVVLLLWLLTVVVVFWTPSLQN